MKSRLIVAVISALLFTLNAAGAWADPHCQRCPYDCDDLGLGHKDCSELSESRGLCCVDLTKKGMRLALEQERALEEEDDEDDAECPAGFTPSERRCTPDERRRGCHDMRIPPNNMGCVSEDFR